MSILIKSNNIYNIVTHDIIKNNKISKVNLDVYDRNVKSKTVFTMNKVLAPKDGFDITKQPYNGNVSIDDYTDVSDAEPNTKYTEFQETDLFNIYSLTLDANVVNNITSTTFGVSAVRVELWGNKQKDANQGQTQWRTGEINYYKEITNGYKSIPQYTTDEELLNTIFNSDKTVAKPYRENITAHLSKSSNTLFVIIPKYFRKRDFKGYNWCDVYLTQFVSSYIIFYSPSPLTCSLEAIYTEKDNYTNGQGENVITLQSNPLIQNKTLINGIKSYELICDKIKNGYKNGKETTILNCAIADYYNENKEIVISPNNSNLPMTFNIGDIVTPYTTTIYGEAPLSVNPQTQKPKQFVVVGIKLKNDGVITQELTLQEYVQ